MTTISRNVGNHAINDKESHQKISEAIPQRDCWYLVTISRINISRVGNAAAAAADDDDDDDSCIIRADADTNSNHTKADTLSLRGGTVLQGGLPHNRPDR